MPDELVPLVVVTGAFDCGKTTTLEYLRDHHGVRIHGEAYLTVLARLGPRTQGHPPGRGFTRVEAPDHLCPMCRPHEFAALVLAEQAELERRAAPGDVLERGWLDPIEMLRRNGGPDAPLPTWVPCSRYAKVMLFDVMPALQRPRWGKDASVRVAEALAINERLAALYADAGHDVVRIAPGSVEARAARVLALLRG